jgi:lipopolysaccharide/colanic/teichoic acid biosynthesis glycosyltransferase
MTGTSSDTVKRWFDLSVASVLLVLSLPVQVVIALLVRRDLGTPVLFRQRRPGRNEEIFELIKFRTMRDLGADDGPGNDDVRVTRFGHALRSTSLDELPSLWNVVKGDMSLVGPRPLLVQYLDRYNDEQRRRHEVRPGLTGLVQVSGRNLLDWDHKLQLDVAYVDRRCLRLDVAILFRTAVAVLRRHGVSSTETVTMSEFLGSSRQALPKGDSAPDES